jgi:N-acetylmuramoyl-L-alanine amidase
VATHYPATGTPPMIGVVLTIPEWLEYVATYDFGSIPPSRLVLHHTFIPNEQQWRGLASMRGMQGYYAGLGWNAAPHIYVGPDGIWLFTPMREVGIHAGKGNSGTVGGKLWYSIGLEMVGYFDTVLPGGAVWEGTRAVIGGLSRRLGIAPDQLVSFHRDYTSQKSCPGWAVTKPWVFGEVNAWLGNQAPPPPPPVGTVGGITPAQEALVELLNNESYKARGEGYSANSAMLIFAVETGMGFPLARIGTVQFGEGTFVYQPFARDTLYYDQANPGEVKRLSALVGGSIPADGLGRVLLDASYRSCGATFRPDWAFHQYAASNQIGVPVGESARITVDGAEYSYQAFALDTLYNLIPNWGDVRRLSAIANDAGQTRLRDALLTETYQRGGAVYHPEWAFHQLARQWNLGCPISANYKVASGGSEYALQVYATDTLYNVVPNWSDVRRLSALTGPQSAVLGDEPLVLGDDVVFEPVSSGLAIVSYAPRGATPNVLRNRRTGTTAIVLHADRGPAQERMDAMLTPGTPQTTHFYITATGVVYQLAAADAALRHAGMAYWQGQRRNLNTTSIGIALETGGSRGRTAAQQSALTALTKELKARYRLTADAVQEWSALRGRK